MSNINTSNTQLQTQSQQPQPALSQTQYSALLALLQQQQQQLQNVQPIQQQQKKRRVWIKRVGTENAQATTVYVGADDIVDDLKMLIIQKYPNSLGRLVDPADLQVWRHNSGAGTVDTENKPLPPELSVFDVLGPETEENANMNEPFLVGFVRDDLPAAPNPQSTEHQEPTQSDGNNSFFKTNTGMTEPPESPKTVGTSSPRELSTSPASINSQYSLSTALNNNKNKTYSSSAEEKASSSVAEVVSTSGGMSPSLTGPINLLQKAAKQPTLNPGSTPTNGVILLPRQFKNSTSSLSSSKSLSSSNTKNTIKNYNTSTKTSTAKNIKNRLTGDNSSTSSAVTDGVSDTQKPLAIARGLSQSGLKSIANNRDENYNRAKALDPNGLIKPSTVRRKQQQQKDDDDSQGERVINRRASSNNKVRPNALTKLSAVTGSKKSVLSPTSDTSVSNNRNLLLSFNKGLTPYTTVVPQINVLIVEDNVINQKILETFLNRRKIRSSTAKNGKEAIEKWRRGGFHLVLMDIQLPVMNGIEATKNIRRLEHINRIGVFSNSSTSGGYREGRAVAHIDPEDLLDTKLFRSPVIIVALTASSSLADKSEALAAGCNDFLTKPVNLKWLEQKTIEWGCMQALIDFEGWKHWVTREPTPASTPTSAVSTAAVGSPGGKTTNGRRTSQGKTGVEKSRSLSAGKIKPMDLAPLTSSLSPSSLGSASNSATRNQKQNNVSVVITPVTSNTAGCTNTDSLGSPNSTNSGKTGGYFGNIGGYFGNAPINSFHDNDVNDSVEQHLAPLTPVSPVTGPPSMQNAIGAVLVTSPSAVAANTNRQRRAAIKD